VASALHVDWFDRNVSRGFASFGASRVGPWRPCCSASDRDGKSLGGIPRLDGQLKCILRRTSDGERERERTRKDAEPSHEHLFDWPENPKVPARRRAATVAQYQSFAPPWDPARVRTPDSGLRDRDPTELPAYVNRQPVVPRNRPPPNGKSVHAPPGPSAAPTSVLHTPSDRNGPPSTRRRHLTLTQYCIPSRLAVDPQLARHALVDRVVCEKVDENRRKIELKRGAIGEGVFLCEEGDGYM
jgi:hypothetical protein